MIRKNNNSLNVNIASLGTLTSALPAAGTVITAANLPAGAVVLVDNGMRLLDATTALTATRGKVVQSLGATKPLVISHDFDIAGSKVSFTKHIKALEQVSSIGFNPALASGSLPAVANTTYYIGLDKMDNDSINRSFYSPVQFDVTTGSVGTQSEVAIGLAANAMKNMAKNAEKNGYLNAFAVTDTAVTLSATASITKGSKVLTSATALIAALPSAGASLLAIPTTKTIGGATVSFKKVYAIESMTASTITLTMAIEEATATGVTIFNGAGTNYGVILEGTKNVFDTLAMRNFTKNRFDVSFSDDSTAVSLVQGATEGAGSGERAMWDEFIGMGIEGQKAIYNVPTTVREETAKIDSAYGVINIKSTEDIHALLNVDRATGSVLVYVELDNSGATAAVTALDSTANFATVLFAGNGLTSVATDLNE